MTDARRRDFLGRIGGLLLTGVAVGPARLLSAADDGVRRRLRSPVTLRAYADADRSAVEALLEPRFVDEHPLLRDRWRGLHTPRQGDPLWHRTLVAEAEGTIVGVGSAMNMAWHPKYHLADVMVQSAWRRRGVGTDLLAGVRELVAGYDRKRLFSQIRPASPGARAFAARRGFSLLMRSRMWRIDPAAPAVTAWCARAETLRHGYEIRADVDPDDDRFMDAVRRLYDWMHRDWNPLGEVSTEAVRTAYHPLIVPGSARLAFRGSEVVGVGCLMRRPRTPPTRPMISMVGAISPTLPRARGLTAHLAAECTVAARALGDGLEAEADDAHQTLAAVLEGVESVQMRELYQLADG